ncbi:hypothetical protein [Spirillospora sp. NBC_01491]|uniref:hypothetical protein n=1 Tax=Spirillospora sp. NBC_01491 TaxID=2976007 RepID=UPI002E380758|nr:hypothetical protein [Spirillospora sp. NBC_01491]
MLFLGYSAAVEGFLEQNMQTPSWRDRIQSGPLWAYFLYFMLFGPLTGGASLLFTDASTSAVLLMAMFGNLSFAGIMTWWMAVMRRRDADATGGIQKAEMLKMARAARTGELPPDRILDHPMLALIERRQRQNRRSLVSLPLILGFGIMYSFVNALNSSANYWWLVGMLFALMTLDWSRLSET